ncbi:hypothetical protein BZL30_9163 [Mycobacterium kansasii]|uniref:Uncharacterized protein n=1 Tax=Mycobacterium kansasii TaxID=1768 RepID=A0A1V3WDS0_MYCKA|nr:hypothetical protein BZL30_9163 [Mycobacterium kansasii]
MAGMVSTVAARPSLHARQGIRCGGANAGAGARVHRLAAPRPLTNLVVRLMN